MIFTYMTIAIIMCLAYSLSLIIIFFVKGNTKNEETKVYKFLLISNFIGLLLHLAAENVCYYFYDIPYYVSFVVLKAMLIYYFSFGMFLLRYLVVVSKLKNEKNIHTLINVCTIFFSIMFLFMPVRVSRDMNQLAFYTYGLDCTLTYYLSSGVILIMIGLLAFQYRKIPKKKLIPLIFFVIGCTLSVIIQNRYPHITIVDLIESLICCLMYFTIENPYENKAEPDVEVLEETIEEKYRRLREERVKELAEEKMNQTDTTSMEVSVEEKIKQGESEIL